MGNSNQHQHYDVPHILVGGAGGKLKGNRHLHYERKSVTTTGNLLLSLLDHVRHRQGRAGRQHREAREAVTRGARPQVVPTSWRCMNARLVDSSLRDACGGHRRRTGRCRPTPLLTGRSIATTCRRSIA